jgi:hypothetical protein
LLQGEVFEHFDIDVRLKIFLGHWLGQRERENQRCGIVATHRRAADQTAQLRRARLLRWQ